MDDNAYLEIMKSIHQSFLEYIDSENNLENDFEKFQNKIINPNIFQSKLIFKSFLYLILEVSNNHSRAETFFSKIEQIFLYNKNEIIKKFSNHEIFNIFKTNKRILLFLIEEKILILDQFISIKLVNPRYKNYYTFFLPEISFSYGLGEINGQNSDFSEF